MRAGWTEFCQEEQNAAAIRAEQTAASGAVEWKRFARGDLRMLCYCRGRERTLKQLGELAKSAGLQVSSVMPAGSRSIIALRRYYRANLAYRPRRQPTAGSFTVLSRARIGAVLWPCLPGCWT